MMSDRSSTRRQFLAGASAGSALLALGDLGFLGRLRPVSAAEQQLDPNVVRLDAGIEPLVRLIETTSRDRLLEEVGDRIQKGLSYRDLLAGLLLAGVRNVEPRPTVGFQFHAVLVVHSAHLASLSGPDSDRWLPIFWALDYFKSAQARDARERDWTMAPVDEAALPSAARARGAFVEAMEKWDESAADAAVAALARSADPQQVFELLFRFGARDYRSIGHKAIFVANSYRVLDVIGQHHAEPLLRSLAYALLNRTGDPNPAASDLRADRPWRRHQELVDRFPRDWEAGTFQDAAIAELLATLRDGSADGASEHVVRLLQEGIGPRAIWAALFDGAAELMLRQNGIVALHAVTTTNAIHQCYRFSADERTRRLLLLQNAAFLPMFREDMARRGSVADRAVERLEPVDLEGNGDAALERIFQTLSRDREAAAREALAYLRAGGDASALIDTARRLIFLKGNNAHDYKFSSAVLEDYHHVPAPWRDLYLAANVVRLRGAGERDNRLVERTRAALDS